MACDCLMKLVISLLILLVGAETRECSDGSFGHVCRQYCNCRNVSEICNKSTGYCESGCAAGYTGTGCHVENIALGKQTKQSGTINDCIWADTEKKRQVCGNKNSSLAVDGRTSSEYWSGTCIHTAWFTWPSWWKVDLEKEHLIKNIKIYFPRPERMFGFRVEIDGSLCYQWPFGFPLPTSPASVTCKQPVYGRNLTIRSYSTDKVLDLCEVEVYECRDGSFGQQCDKSCNCADVNETCNKETGHCDSGCSTGYSGLGCKEECEDGMFGVNCTSNCTCNDDTEVCDKVTGSCLSGCPDGYTGSGCQFKCRDGWFGQKCNQKCQCKNLEEVCNKTTGQCEVSGCGDGWTGLDCYKDCPNGTYGFNCSQQCGHCGSDVCNKTTGHCPKGCERGWRGMKCTEDCEDGVYGFNCSFQCGQCNGGTACGKIMGECSGGCEEGFQLPLCQAKILNESGFKFSLPMIAVISVLGFAIALSLVTGIICIIRKKTGKPSGSSNAGLNADQSATASTSIYEKLNSDQVISLVEPTYTGMRGDCAPAVSLATYTNPYEKHGRESEHVYEVVDLPLSGST